MGCASEEIRTDRLVFGDVPRVDNRDLGADKQAF